MRTATVRASTSVLLPAPNGTTRRIGLTGNCAVSAAAAAPATSDTASNIVFITPPVLVRLGARLLDGLAPAHDFGAQETLEFGRCRGGHIHALHGQALAHIRCFAHAHYVVVQLLHNGRRSARGYRNAPPRGHVVIGIARFGDRRQVRRSARTRLAGDRDGAQT